MSEVIKVGMADYKVTKAPNRLITLGLGSCIGITLYDKNKKIGGMAHIMLPKNNDPTVRSLKFADVAITEMIKEMEALGVRTRDIEAKIAGGAQMFSFTASDEKKSVGYRNIAFVKDFLKEKELRLIAEDTGGNVGRTIEIDLVTGVLSIKTIGKGEAKL